MAHDISLPEHRRALIVDDEIVFAINLEADMYALGFDASRILTSIVRRGASGSMGSYGIYSLPRRYCRCPPHLAGCCFVPNSAVCARSPLSAKADVGRGYEAGM